MRTARGNSEIKGRLIRRCWATWALIAPTMIATIAVDVLFLSNAIPLAGHILMGAVAGALTPSVRAVAQEKLGHE